MPRTVKFIDHRISHVGSHLYIPTFGDMIRMPERGDQEQVP